MKAIPASASLFVVVHPWFTTSPLPSNCGIQVDADLCERLLRALLQRPIVVTDIELFEAARRICRRYELRYWDAAIVAATARLGAPVLYSEDLNDGQVYDGVRVVNPFRRLN